MLANLFAQREPDPRARRVLLEELGCSPRIEVSTRGKWVLAREPVVGGARAEVRAVAFAEGEARWIGEQHPAVDWGRAAEVLTGPVDKLSQAPGDFTAFVVDDRDELTVTRSVAGVAPVYVWPDPERPAASTRLRELVRWSVKQPVLDAEAIATYSAARQFPGESSPISGVRLLPPGTRARSTTGFRTERYWELSAFSPCRPTRRALAEHAERLRSLLLLELETGLADEGNLFTLSGGVDSSALAVLARRRFGRGISTLTFLPEATCQRARAQSQVRRVLEEIRDVHEGHTEHVLSVDLRLELARRTPMALVPVAHPALLMLSALASARPIRAYVGGEFADMLIGSLTHDDDWLSVTSIADVFADLGQVPYLVTRSMDWLKLRVRRRAGLVRPPMPATLPSYFRRELAEPYRTWCRHRCAQLSRPGGRQVLSQRLDRCAWVVAQNWELASSLGVARRFPFFSRDQLELALSTHPLIHAGPGSKRALRLSLRGEVPDWVLAREDKGIAGPRAESAAAWPRERLGELEQFLAPEWARKAPALVDGMTALRLWEVLNIVGALRNEGQYREQVGQRAHRGSRPDP